MQTGEVAAIHVGPRSSGELAYVEAVRAVAGTGLEGDRYFRSGNEAKRQVTLIEVEAVEAIARDEGIDLRTIETRRNIATRGLALNHLVGRTFRVGDATFHGLKLCEPCGHMERLAGREGLRRALVHRGGLRAEIVETGDIRVGDPIVVEP